MSPSSVSPLLVVADLDAEIRATVSGFMAARGYEVRPAADANTAMGLLLTAQVDVLISDLAMRGGGLELLEFARSSAPATRSIAVAGAATVHDREAALRLGALRVLAKPLSLLELADAVGLARDCSEGFHGWMHRMPLVDVLQMYHHAAQSLVIRVRGDVTGSISLLGGDIIHAASAAGRTGTAALTELLGAARGELETGPLVERERTIQGSFEHALLDALRALDESRRRGRVATVPPFEPWLDYPTEPDVERDVLVQWLADHAPGAAMWRVDPVAGSVERIDAPGANPEQEIGGTAGSIGWAYELAEATDPTWSRVELMSGSLGIALVRAAGRTVAFARLITGDAVQRQFHFETARLAGWLGRALEALR